MKQQLSKITEGENVWSVKKKKSVNQKCSMFF